MYLSTTILHAPRVTIHLPHPPCFKFPPKANVSPDFLGLEIDDSTNRLICHLQPLKVTSVRLERSYSEWTSRLTSNSWMIYQQRELFKITLFLMLSVLHSSCIVSAPHFHVENPGPVSVSGGLSLELTNPLQQILSSHEPQHTTFAGNSHFIEIPSEFPSDLQHTITHSAVSTSKILPESSTWLASKSQTIWICGCPPRAQKNRGIKVETNYANGHFFLNKGHYAA